MANEKQDKADERKPDAGDDAGAAQVQELVDEAQDRGYLGEVPDPTPNENYTLAGVNRGLPTPETDADLARDAHDRTVPRPFDPDRTALQASRDRGARQRGR